jgi:type IV secretory pathway TraG/TraD family ATPase VirD4
MKTQWGRDETYRWLFITSPPEFRERLRPLISMWLDMLVLRLMNQGQPGVRPVWFILDELQSLHALPQLHTAITESRKAKNPVVLGFQGRSQMEELYGRKAEAMLSQPATKIFLRTDEANSAKWISQTIGEVEIEQLRESRMEGHFPANRRDSRNYQLDRHTERSHRKLRPPGPGASDRGPRRAADGDCRRVRAPAGRHARYLAR